MLYNIANSPCFDVSRNAHAWRSAMTLHHPIVTSIDVDQPAGGTRCYVRSAIDPHVLVVRACGKTITGVLAQARLLNPARTSQTDQAQAQCTLRLTASFCARDNERA